MLVRQGETFSAYMRETADGIAIGIVRPNSKAVWEGYALFPRELKGEAERRFAELHNDVDVEDMLREWADPDGRTVANFEGFMAHDEATQ